MRSERKKQIYLHFSEPQGRKACVAGLKRKAENGKLLIESLGVAKRKKTSNKRPFER